MLDWLFDLFDGRTFGAARSSKWSRVRESFIALHPRCAVCGTKGSLLKPNEVHHILPFHKHPELELMESNLCTLCRVHHLWFGHLGSFKSHNADIVVDALYWNDKIKNRQ